MSSGENVCAKCMRCIGAKINEFDRSFFFSLLLMCIMLVFFTIKTEIKTVYQLTTLGALSMTRQLWNLIEKSDFFGILCDKHVLYFWFYTPPPRVFVIATLAAFLSFHFFFLLNDVGYMYSPIPRLRGIKILLTYCSWNFSIIS